MPFFVCARHGRAPVEPMDYRVSNAAQSGARSRDLYLKPLLLDFVVKSAIIILAVWKGVK